MLSGMMSFGIGEIHQGRQHALAVFLAQRPAVVAHHRDQRVESVQALGDEVGQFDLAGLLEQLGSRR